MTPKRRVPFGSEQNINTGPSDHCHTCHATHGTPHKPGCNEEQCPNCCSLIIGCGCNSLSTMDSALIIQSLYRKFTNLETALRAVTFHENKGKQGTSYLVHAAMLYLFEHIDEKSREEITQKFHLSFPTLNPTMYDKNGTGYYTPEQLAKAFDVTVEEINDRIEALSSAGFTIKKNEIENLKKSN